MYKSAGRFLSRPPAGRFWTDVARLYTPREIGGGELLLAALAQAIVGSGARVRLDQFSDYETAGLALILGNQGLIGGPLVDGVLAQLDRRLEGEGPLIHFSETERVVLDRFIFDAASNWKRR